MLIVAIYLLFPSSPLSVSHTGTISSGANYYLYDKFSILRSGRLTVQFSESNGQTLQVFVFDDAQYVSFTAGQSLPGLYSSGGSSSGTFSVSFPSFGSYYLVFTHGAGLESVTENVSFSVTLDGYNPVILGLGGGILVAGAISIVLGYRLRNKHLDKNPRAASDVVVFDKPQPPPAPSP